MSISRNIRLMKAVSILVLYAVFLLDGLAGAASFSVGQAKLVIGAVNVTSEEKGDYDLKTGDAVYQGDLLTSEGNGFAVITLSDDTKFTLKPNSEFKIKSVKTAEADQEVLTELLKGGLKVITGQVAKQQPDRFKVETPLGSIGVRGTNFDIQLCLEQEECTLMNTLLKDLLDDILAQGRKLFVVVTEGTTTLLDCVDIPQVSTGQLGISDGTAEGCQVINIPKEIFDNFLWQDDEELDKLLNSLDAPILQELDEIFIQCAGDPLCIQCQGDPVCTQCNGDPSCYQCQGDPLCNLCNGDPLCIQCNGDPLCVQCNGDPLCIQCNGDPLCVQCNANQQCIQCNGDPLCQRCGGDPLCIQCNGDSLCRQCNGDPLCIACGNDPLCLCQGNRECQCGIDPGLPQCMDDPGNEPPDDDGGQ